MLSSNGKICWRRVLSSRARERQFNLIWATLIQLSIHLPSDDAVVFVYCRCTKHSRSRLPILSNCNTWSAPSVTCPSDQNANSASGKFLCVSELTLCQRSKLPQQLFFSIFHNLILPYFSLFSHRVFNVTGHGTVAPLTKRSAGCAGTSLPRPSPLLLLQLALPQQTLLQGIVSVHLVSLLPFLRLAPCGQPHSYCSHSSSTGVYRGPAVTYLG